MAAFLLLVLTLGATLLAGCAVPWPFPQPTPDPKLPDSQQILRPLEVGPASGDLETLDPALIEYSVDENLGQLIFPQFVTLDDQSKPVDWVAESHEISADGLTYTFHLRKDMTWSDGAPIDAQTFAYALNRALDPCTQAPNAKYLYSIKGAQMFNTGACPPGAVKSATTLIGSSLLAPDPLTLQIILQQPAGYFLTVLTTPLAWGVPQALVERFGDKWSEHLADNGGFGGNLYRLTRWDHAGHLDLERNERFWGVKPQLRRIEYTLYKSLDAAWPDFIAGNGDTAQPPLALLPVAKDLKGSTIQQSPLLGVSWLSPNWHFAPFDDVRIRQALSLVIDRTRLAHEVFADTVLPSIHLVPEGMPGYNAALADAAHRTGEDALVPDLVTARALVNAYATEKCRGDVALCPPINVHCSSCGDLRIRTAQMIQTFWREAFPSWSISSSSGCGGWQCSSFEGAFQLEMGGWLDDYPDPQNFLSDLWTSTALYNYRHVSIPEVDTLCAQADATLDQTTRIPLYQRAEQLLVTQGGAIPLNQWKATYAVHSRVVGWHVATTGMTPLSVWQATYMKR
jgi:ABC-type oligopeptide transport system substrate-binding subunit